MVCLPCCKLTKPPQPTPTHTPDIYTDMMEFEKAAKYYDMYISRMDDSVV